MPTPVSSPDSSYYDPTAQFTPAEGPGLCGTASVAPPSSSAPEVTVPPVLIMGDAGAQQLVKQLDSARQAPDCSLEGANAALSCGKAGLVAAGGVLLTTTVVGAGLAVAGTFAESVSCGKDLRAYYDCKVQ